MRFVKNPRLEQQLAKQPAGRRALKQAAEPAAQEAERIARAAGEPWMPRRGADLITVDESGDEVRIVNTDHAAHLAEFGSVNNPAHAPLRRGARAAGLKLRDT